MQAAESTPPTNSKARCRRLSAHEMLRAKLAVLPHVGALNLFNARGALINSVRDVAGARQVTIADRRYFQEFTSGKPTPDVIVEPVVSKVTGSGPRCLRARSSAAGRDHRLCQPRRRAFPFRGLRRVAGAGQRHRNFDDPPRWHRHRALSQGRQADRPQRRQSPRFSARWLGGNIVGTLQERAIGEDKVGAVRR
jgi:hypothetical protein